ncbi:Fur family transcriptional regulator [Acetobacterium wieringae]|jgi:Fur family ferric uptake transcriptional regulator|uniref:Transcriptional repressor n=1 Tax=Acetobacterium wieringae TaxID=52694 RepID=A0A5D0WUG7_9FIRM|nr:Fur family transcriptional regulator [Acetobacterium wieringae]MEA4806802.1 Fur family transcriptional regulator [Acetobacterium wieringae]TYC87844.1 transcriptional repressor [Acetobacterium wieringae]URN83636.1 transcriptional repressor [Acetobacterium wieringae]HAZ06144.1 transcriptional repressor [Acetobacterium sp.]
MNNQKQIVDALRKRGNKVTPQRLVTIEVLMTFREQHFSVEELFQGVKQRNPDVGMSTIYRTVQILEEMGLITKRNFDDGFARYELCELDEKHWHHHLICLKCGKVIEMQDDFLEVLEKEIEEKKEFIIINHELKVYGYCSDCYGITKGEQFD